MARTNVNVADQVYQRHTFSKELDGRPEQFTVSEAAMSMGNSVNSKVMVQGTNRGFTFVRSAGGAEHGVLLLRCRGLAVFFNQGS